MSKIFNYLFGLDKIGPKTKVNTPGGSPKGEARAQRAQFATATSVK